MISIRKKILIFAAVLFAIGGTPRAAHAQFIGFTSPQSTQGVVMNAVTGPVATPITTPQTKCPVTAGNACQVQNLGQTVHIASYKTTNPANINRLVFRIEGSWDGTNFIAISDDATGAASGEVLAIGFYPFIRVNLAEFVLSGAATLSANYAGSSATSGPLYGVYNPSQAIQKVVASGAVQGTSANFTIPTPTGSGMGYLVALAQTSFFPTGSSLTVENIIGGIVPGTGSPTTTIPTGGNFAIAPVPYMPGGQMLISYTAGGASANLFDLFYIFIPAGMQSGISGTGMQPIPATTALTQNSETTSAANTEITKSFAALPGTRVSLFSVNARCSAGTASLTVKDGVAGTVIWSTATTEVSTTTFKFQWAPGLASSFSAGMDIILSTCGGGNTGTLDVQISQQ